MFSKLLLLFLCISSLSFANYAWIPKYQNMRLRLSGEYYKSQDNFTEDGQRASFNYLNRPAQLTEYEFALQSEYGFAKDWSAGIKLPFRSSSISGADYGDTYLSATGFGDTAFSFKWLVKSGDTRLAIESISTVPFYSTSVTSTDEMVLGDGIFTTGFKLHGGHLMDGMFSFALSPGVLFKFQGFTSQFTVDAAFGVAVKPVYFRLFSDLAISMGGESFSTGIFSNPAEGSGGSFAKLSTSPNLWNLGLLAGVFVYEQYRIELYGTQSITGNRAPNGYRFGIAFATSFDFYKEEKKIQVKELPFDAEPTPERP